MATESHTHTRAQSRAQQALHATVILLCLAALLSLAALWVPVVMAAWVAILVGPVHKKLGARLGGSHRAAGLLTVGLVLALLIPSTFVAVSLTGEAIALVKRVLASNTGTGALQSIVTGQGGSADFKSFNPQQVFDFMKQHGAGTWRTLTVVAGATAWAIVGVFVFVLGSYVFLVDGKQAYNWFADHAPLERGHFHRLAQAFSETGRGLFIGVGLTALAQGALATVGYFALGLPQAAVLGGLTMIAAFIPAGGAGLVWAPVTIALAVSGRPAAAAIMLAIGLLVSTADNFLRPVLTRYGELKLPTFVLLLSMFGGIAIFGTWGLILGPLLVRMAVEGLKIVREQKLEHAL